MPKSFQSVRLTAEVKLRAQTCLFCDRQPGSREHLWAAWIHERLPKREPIRITFANRPIAISKNPEIKVKTGCRVCNNGWMSDLEAACIPVIGNLMQDISLQLDTSQQSLLLTWAVKTAMVLDSTNTRERTAFYTRSECEQLRLTSAIPAHTRVWIGRSALNGLHADGTDVWIMARGGTSRIAIGNTSTFIVGHLALQVFAVHPLPEQKDKYAESVFNDVPPRPGPWSALLIQIWPGNGRIVTWPPPQTFTGTGTALPHRPTVVPLENGDQKNSNSVIAFLHGPRLATRALRAQQATGTPSRTKRLNASRTACRNPIARLTHRASSGNAST